MLLEDMEALVSYFVSDMKFLILYIINIGVQLDCHFLYYQQSLIIFQINENTLSGLMIRMAVI